MADGTRGRAMAEVSAGNVRKGSFGYWWDSRRCRAATGTRMSATAELRKWRGEREVLPAEWRSVSFINAPLFLGTGVRAWKKWSANPGIGDIFLQNETPFPRYRGACTEEMECQPGDWGHFIAERDPFSSVQGCLHERNGAPTRGRRTISCRNGPLFRGTGVFAWKKRTPIPMRRAENERTFFT